MAAPKVPRSISKQKQKKILALTPAWMEGKITTYYVFTHTKVEQHTAKKYLEKYAAMIKGKEKEIVENIKNPVIHEEKLTIWERISRRILSSLFLSQKA